jgi:prepilin-type processing-associated H-X9-DG protein
LLVVGAIVAVLIGLSLAAVQQAREQAARLQCQGNLHNIGVALLSYQSSAGAFPPAFSTQPPRYLSWMGRLLPYADQGALARQSADAYAADPWPWDEPPHPADSVVALFACPSDPRVLQAAAPKGVSVLGESGELDLRVGLTSYLGVSGTDLRARDGMFYVDSFVRPTDIHDGASHTLLVGERPPSPDFNHGWWYAAPGQGLTGSADVVLGAREWNVTLARPCPAGPYRFGPGRLTDPCDQFHFWSLHRGGANFLMADGSVRFLSYSAADLLPALATRSGGEVVPDE